jgi:hypothetical protein
MRPAAPIAKPRGWVSLAVLPQGVRRPVAASTRNPCRVLEVRSEAKISPPSGVMRRSAAQGLPAKPSGSAEDGLQGVKGAVGAGREHVHGRGELVEQEQESPGRMVDEMARPRSRFDPCGRRSSREFAGRGVEPEAVDDVAPEARRQHGRVGGLGPDRVGLRLGRLDLPRRLHAPVRSDRTDQCGRARGGAAAGTRRPSRRPTRSGPSPPTRPCWRRASGATSPPLRFDAATGELAGGAPAARVEAGSGPRHFVYHPTGRFLFLLNELTATVDVFAPAPTAPFTPCRPSSALPEGFAGKPWAADLRITPDGGLIFASERTSSTLQGFRVDAATGRLTPCGSTASETQPRGFAIGAAGRILVAAGEASHGITAYAIDAAAGTLTPTARRAVGRSPNWVEILELVA